MKRAKQKDVEEEDIVMVVHITNGHYTSLQSMWCMNSGPRRLTEDLIHISETCTYRPC